MACTTYQALDQTPSQSNRVCHPQASSPGSAARWYETVGLWIERSRQRKALRELAELTGIPVVTTLMARGAFPDSHRQHLGMPGMHGTVAAVAGLQRSDLLIALGTRFDDRVNRKARLVRARGQGHPRRHRPGRDRQEPQRRRADRW